MRLSDLNEEGRGRDKVVVRFDDIDYEVVAVYLDRGVLVLETSRFNEDDGTGVTEEDIV